MRILVSGGSGFIGTAVCERLRRAGNEVVTLSRRAAPGAIRWDPASGAIDAAAVDGFDGVVHLAGENIGAGRWTTARRRRILDSRRHGTQLLAATLAKATRRPTVLVSVSGINYYGDRGDELLTEDSPTGSGFLAEVCRQWEAATEPASDADIRVCRLRTGMVLAADGGALARLLLPFRLGLGGPLGSGRQWMSWITRDDLAAVIERALVDPGFAGPVNAVSPGAVTNREFSTVLGRVLRRPAILPAPAPVLRLALGAMADEVLLASVRVAPTRLAAAGFAISDRELEPALRRMLGRPAAA
jgi:uncharacterized protein (TIGR01777 family)